MNPYLAILTNASRHQLLRSNCNSASWIIEAWDYVLHIRHSTCYTSILKVSGLAGSKISLAHMSVTMSVSPILTMLCV